MFLEQLEAFTKENVFVNQDTSGMVSLRAGGKAKYFIEPSSVKALNDAITLCNDYGVNYVIIGCGSNMLFSDKGFNGLLISLKKLNSVYLNGDILTAFAGAKLTEVFNLASGAALSGFEELFGIPGSVGGAVKMNAGAFKKSISDIVTNVTCLSNGKIKKRYAEDCDFTYRGSVFNSCKDIIISADFKLKPSDPISIREKCAYFGLQRKNLQPKGYTCGSVFKNPKGHFAGKLLEDANLKATEINGAVISDKHANFIINKGRASASDVYSLIEYAKIKVKEKFNLQLEEELVLIGDF